MQDAPMGYSGLVEEYKWYDSLSNRKLDLAMSCIFDCKSLLDVGCGTGEFILKVNGKYPNIEISGLDANKESYQHCKNKFLNIRNIKLYHDDILHFSHERKNIKETFDCITLFDVLEHNTLEDIRVILKMSYNLLNINGKIIITTPGVLDKAKIKYFNLRNKSCDHITGLTSYGWLNEIKKAGFILIWNRTVQFPFVDRIFLNKHFHLLGKCHMIFAKKVNTKGDSVMDSMQGLV